MPKLISTLKNETDVLGSYTKEMHRMLEHRKGSRKKTDSGSSGNPASGGERKQ